MIDITLKILGERIHIGKKEGATAKGVHILSVCDARSGKAQEISSLIERVSSDWGRWRDEGLRVEIKWMEAKLKEDKNSQDFCFELLQNIEKAMHGCWEEYKYLIGQLNKGFLKNEIVVENITTTVGRTVSARRLSGSNTYSGNISHTALGTSNTAAVVGDSQLGTETYRKALSSGTFANNIAYIETFFTAAEVNGTFQEYGNFIDGSGTVNSGQLFNRFTQTVVKSVTETLNVQSTVTFNDA